MALIFSLSRAFGLMKSISTYCGFPRANDFVLGSGLLHHFRASRGHHDLYSLRSQVITTSKLETGAKKAQPKKIQH